MNALAPSALIAGKYVLDRPLARGGMGAVWVARHRDLDVDVAIKFMTDAFVSSDDARARFEREAKAAAKLDTKHVVHVHDYGVDRGTPYIVMELLRGEDLAARLAREKMLSLVATSTLLSQIAKGLRKAHEAGLVHRDLKPANIFLAMKDDEEVVKILDFGIAKTTGTGLAAQATASGVVIGSVHYMSPEQVRRSKEVDQRSDLWSLAVILFRIVTGRLPFMGEETGDVLVKVCADPVPVPSQVAPGLPAPVDVFFAKALSRSPDERFQSAQEMADAFALLTAPPALGVAQTSPAARLNAPAPPPGVDAESETNALTLVKTQVWHKASQTAVSPPREHAANAETLNPSQRTMGRANGDERQTLLWIASGAMTLAAVAIAAWLGLRGPSTASTRPAATPPISSVLDLDEATTGGIPREPGNPGIPSSSPTTMMDMPAPTGASRPSATTPQRPSGAILTPPPAPSTSTSAAPPTPTFPSAKPAVPMSPPAKRKVQGPMEDKL